MLASTMRFDLPTLIVLSSPAIINFQIVLRPTPKIRSASGTDTSFRESNSLSVLMARMP
jgi:hypothetical protein